MEWEGLHLYDFVFPLFLFITGAGVAIALPRTLAVQPRPAVYVKILRRSLLMYALGLLYYGGFALHWDDLRYVGVLQRIAVCYFVTSILFLNLRPRALATSAAAILLLYWAVMSFIPAPGGLAGSLAPEANLADWIDRTFLPGRLWYGVSDPEGLLSTGPAIATCMLGALAGALLNSKFPPARIALLLVGGGAALLVAGFVWSLWFPIIKSLWTSSFALVTAGASAMLLGLAWHLLDVWRVVAATSLARVGMNAITLYMLSGFGFFDQVAVRLVGGDFGVMIDRFTAPGASALLTHVIGLALAVGLAEFLYRKRVFIRL